MTDPVSPPPPGPWRQCPGLVDAPTLVDPEVSRRKVRRFLADWEQQRDIYRARGWVILDVYDELIVEVAVTAKMAGIGPAGLDIIPACVRVDYRNFDLWAPSVTFIDLLSRAPTLPPVRALQLSEAGLRDVLIDGHPATNLPFLCLPGTREYHAHPQHSGDDWLLHRSQGAGNLAVVIDRVWRTMAVTVQGLGVMVQALNPPMGGQLTVQLIQAPTLAALLVAQQPPAGLLPVEPA